jgi:hypothetical protein
MDLEIAKFFVSLGHGSIIDVISQIVSSRIFIAALWVVVIGVVLWKCKTKRKRVVVSFVFSVILFYVV